MQTQDLVQLKQALQYTLNPNQQIIQSGEQFLNQSKLLPNYAISLLMIVDDAQNDINIRQSALVNMKTFLEKSWRSRKNNPDAFEIPEQEKQIIRGTFIDALVRCVQEKKLRSQYEDLIYKLVSIDYPDQWPDLVQSIVFRLSSLKSYEETWACLVSLRRVCENYQFMMDEDRKPLEPIVQVSFPILEGLMQKFLESYNEQTGILIKIILKIFHHCMHMQLPLYLQDTGKMQIWMQYMKMLLDSQVSQELGQLTIDENEMLRREKTYVWANKKWIGRIMVRVAQKYFNPKLVTTDIKKYSEYLQQQYAVQFMESFYQIMATSQQQFQAPRTCLFALKYLYYALRLPTTNKLMQPHLEKLLFDIALPSMQLTTRDDRIWKEDPDEYIRRLEDFSVASYNIKNSANDLLEQVTSSKDLQGVSYLIHFLQYAQQSLKTGIDQRTNQQLSVLRKEAILWGIETQCKNILKIENIQDSMEDLMEKYIIPEFQSQIGFLRARACSLFAHYGTIEFKNRLNITRAVEGIYKCILDKELPVRVAAAVSFSSILRHKEAQDMIRPGLSQVLETYIKLMDVIDNEGIVRSLEDIVQDFQNEIVPYAVQLAQHLSNIFLKYCAKQNQGDQDDSDDDGEAELAASGCLEAIKRILNSPLNDEAYTAMEPLLFPILNFCLTEAGCDFISEALELLNLILYKRKTGLTPGLWFYYPVLVYILIGLPQQINLQQTITGLSDDQYLLLEGCKKDWGSEFLRQMLGSIRNFIQKGGDAMLNTNDMFGNNLLSLVFKIIDKIYTISQNGSDETDLNAVTTLLITLLENFRGRIDATIPQILDLCLSNLTKPKSNRFKIVSLGVIFVCIHYNPTLALAYLTQQQAIDNVLILSFQLQKHWKYQWDLHRFILGVCSLYSLPNSQIPNYLLQNVSVVSKQLVEFTTRVLQAREEEESCEQEEQAIEEDENQFEKTLEKIQKVGQSLNDDDDDDEDDDEDFDGDEDDDYANLYESPLEAIDEVLLLEQLFISLKQTNPQLYQQMVGALTPQEQEQFTKNVNEAKVQYEEWLQSKQQQGVN